MYVNMNVEAEVDISEFMEEAEVRDVLDYVDIEDVIYYYGEEELMKKMNIEELVKKTLLEVHNQIDAEVKRIITENIEKLGDK